MTSLRFHVLANVVLGLVFGAWSTWYAPNPEWWPAGFLYGLSMWNFGAACALLILGKRLRLTR